MVDGYLNFDTKVDTSGFNKGTQAITKQSSKISGIFSTALGTALGFGIEQMAQKAVSGLINISTQAIELASDLDEVQNVVDVAFGDMAYKCEEFAETAVEQFGMSKLTAKQTASTYMAMAKSMGLSMDNASDMAIEVAGLTGDVASFYNISTDLASTKLKSIFTGETETLKDLGVVMTETNLKQYALSQGITKSYSNMSQAEKVALRYNFVMDSLADAQGDFARTSNSWANQTRVLSERWKELLGILGSGLIQALTPVVQMINTVLSALINLANAFAKTIGKIFGMNTTVTQTKKSTAAAAATQSELADATEDTAAATEEAGKAAKGSLASFDKLNVLQQNSTSSSTSGAGAGDGSDMLSFDENDTALTNPDTSGVDTLIDRFSVLEDMLTRIKASWDKWFGNLPTLDITIDSAAIATALADIGAYIANVVLGWGSFVVTIAINIANDLDLGKMGQRFLELVAAVSHLASALTDVLVPAFEAVYDIVLSPILQVIGGTINEVILPLLTDSINFIANFIEQHGTVISSIITGVGTSFLTWKIIAQLTKEFQALRMIILGIQGPMVAGTLATKAYGLATKVAAAAQKIFNAVMATNPIAAVVLGLIALAAAFKYAWDNSETFRTAVTNLWEKIKEGATNAWETVKAIFTALVDTWNNIRTSVSETVTAISDTITEIWDGISEKVSSVVTAISDAVTGVWDAISEKTSTVFGAIKEVAVAVWDAISEKVSGVVTAIRDIVVEIWDAISEKTSDVFGGIKDFITDTFIPAWNKAWKGLATKFVNIWNTVVGIVESGVNLIIKAVNWCIDQINKIHVDVPDWVEDITGMSSFGFNIPNISEVTLSRLSAPKLASGAVIPPNGEFMAMLGDQKNGRNLEAPESLIRQIVREETGGGNIVINANGTMGQLIRLLKLEVEKEDKRAGRSFIKAGAY